MTVATEVVAPYRGLAPFGDSELDALMFFGRERETEIATANLIASRLTVLFGASGVGKTSLLRAGVARRVRELGARRAVGRGPDLACVVVASWGGDTSRALADAVEAEVAPLVSPIAPRPPEDASLADVLEHWSALLDGDLCLVLDQLEEYFVYHQAGPLVDELPQIVLRPDLRANVLLSLRDDALALLDVFKPSIPNVFANHLRLDRLDRDAARAAILGPLERWNELFSADDPVTIEPELVEEVLAEAASGAEVARVEPPYLQLVMERVWNEERSRGSSVLRLSTLAELGGAAAIVREHLDRALSALDENTQEAAARMFEHLVTPSGTKIAHRASDLAEFARLRSTDAEPVLEALGRERILRPLDDLEGDRYEIFHDVLAQAILEWRRRRELEYERATTRRRLRRLAAVAVAAVAALVVMTAVSVYALSQRRVAGERADELAQLNAVAEARRKIAEENELQAEAQASAARALGGKNTDPAKALDAAVEAVTLSPTPDNQRVLRDTLRDTRLLSLVNLERSVSDVEYVAGGPRLLATTPNGGVARVNPRRGGIVDWLERGGPGRKAALAPDGSAAVVFGRGPSRIVRADGSTRLLESGVTTAVVTTAVFSPDATRVIQTLRGGGVRISYATTGVTRAEFDTPAGLSASSTALASLILVRSPNSVVRVYNGRGALLREVVHPGLQVAAIGPNSRFATAGDEGRVVVWDLRGRGDREFNAREGKVQALAFSPGGGYVAAGTASGLAHVWTILSSEHIADITAHTNIVEGVRFSADGKALATWSRDLTARISNVDTGVARAVLTGHDNDVTDVAFDGSSRHAATASKDRNVRIWDAAARRFLLPVKRFGQPLTRIEFVDGQLLVRTGRGATYAVDPQSKRTEKLPREPLSARSDDGRTVAAVRGRFVVVSGSKAARLDARRRIRDVAVSRDGRYVAAAAGRTALLWTLATGRAHTLRRHTGLVTSVDFSSDGRRLLTGSLDDHVREWRTETGKFIRSRAPQFGDINDARYSPDGLWIVTAGLETAGLLRAGTLETMFLLQGHTDQLTGATFDADSRTIFTVARDGTVRKYVCEICGDLEDVMRVARQRLERFRD